MAGVTINVDVNRALQRIGATRDQARQALIRALNKTITSARVKTVAAIKDAGFKVSTPELKKHLRIYRASSVGDEIVVAIRSISRPLALAKFEVLPKKRRRGQGFVRPSGGLWATVMGQRYGAKDAFFAQMPSGHIGVFRRTTAARLPIVEVTGPTIPEGLANEAVLSTTKAAFDARFSQVLEHELEFVVG